MNNSEWRNWVSHSLRLRRYVVLLVVFGSAFTSPAFACRHYVDPIEKVQQARADGTLISREIFVITSSLYTGPPGGDVHYWRASARMVDPVTKANGRQLIISGGGSSVSCDPGFKRPKVGDKWQVYFVSGGGFIAIPASYRGVR